MEILQWGFFPAKQRSATSWLVEDPKRVYIETHARPFAHVYIRRHRVSVSPRENVDWNYVKRRYSTLCVGASLPFCVREPQTQRLQTHWPMRVTVISIDFSPRKSPERAISLSLSFCPVDASTYESNRNARSSRRERKVRVITLLM